MMRKFNYPKWNGSPLYQKSKFIFTESHHIYMKRTYNIYRLYGIFYVLLLLFYINKTWNIGFLSLIELSCGNIQQFTIHWYSCMQLDENNIIPFINRP